MPNARVSQFTDGVTPEDADLFGVARGAANRRLLWSALKLAMPFTLIASQLRATDGQVDFTSIPATYSHLLLMTVGRSTRLDNSYDNLKWRVNNDSSTGNYDGSELSVRNTAVGGFGWTTTSSAPGPIISTEADPAGLAGYGFTLIPFYANTSFQKLLLTFSGHSIAAQGAGSTETDITTGRWLSTAAINRITSVMQSGAALKTGSHVRLYGIL